MTSLSAKVFGLESRGQVKEGFYADLVLFDAATVRDLATYDEPKTEPAGVALVVINGKVGLQDGEHRHAGSGKMLRFKKSAYGE